jgi:hypothetical protein
MRGRRFLLLAATLVALNTALWLVPQGLALQQVVVAKLFGKNMMRAEVKERSGADWRIDRGIVVSNSPGVLTLQEADTTVQPIATSSSTRVTGGTSGTPLKLRSVRPGWQVLVTWPNPSGPADSIVVEKKHS